uniref:Uncharacterized protein n=1 Tax=Cacopsylla melanoneura TaxID=428564 RepID=A0A8D8T719_9HEMI
MEVFGCVPLDSKTRHAGVVGVWGCGPAGRACSPPVSPPPQNKFAVKSSSIIRQSSISKLINTAVSKRCGITGNGDIQCCCSECQVSNVVQQYRVAAASVK